MAGILIMSNIAMMMIECDVYCVERCSIEKVSRVRSVESALRSDAGKKVVLNADHSITFILDSDSLK